MSIRLVSLFALAFLSATGRAYVLIDDFTGGYFKATITGQGNKDHLATGLDTAHVLAGHRYTDYTANANANQMGYVSTFEVGLGEARVTTPGPTDMSTELDVAYGGGFFAPMNMDVLNDPVFEIDLGTDPPNLFAEVWSIRVIDGHGKSSVNETFGARIGGIRFVRAGFVGGPIDWSDIDEFQFRQSWNAEGTAPFSYWATQIRAVPEPCSIVVLSSIFLIRRRWVRPRID